MEILHVSAECYPAAKSGGLGDVVGALPKYLNQAGVDTAVILPRYNLKWLNTREYRLLYSSHVQLGAYPISYSIEECLHTERDLGFKMYVVNCPAFFSRGNVYADDNGVPYLDEIERWLTFQQAVIHFVLGLSVKPKVIHCHDHHTGLIPFMMKNCPDYRSLHNIPTIFTIHNGLYQGIYPWQKSHFLPPYFGHAAGILDWNGTINCMAAAIKSSWYFTTVSNGYLEELKYDAGGLEPLINHEWHKAYGILNGIDNAIWDPATDPMIHHKFSGNVIEYKSFNKKHITELFGVRNDVPLFVFIGRLVSEKGANLIPHLIGKFLGEGGAASFIVLGTGEHSIQDGFKHLAHHFKDRVGAAITYNEELSHQLYAAADFLLMPSRVEPCGLNQLYALRYGTVPIVRATGGLKDTVVDFASPQGGAGINFTHFDSGDALMAIYRAMQLYWDMPELFQTLRNKIMHIDHSWENAAGAYIYLYKKAIGVV